uniref:Uncharacterized protein n=2 Tax=Avena sativa TaxID=4498 RepID=A0ACD5YV33_AVESA
MEEKNPGKKQKKARTTTLQAEGVVPAEAEAEVPAAAGLLTNDLIVEILSRLPARSVHRFKCVSPSWRDLIADPAHRKNLPHTLAGFFYSTFNRANPRLQDSHFASVSVGASPPDNPSLPFLPPDEYPPVDASLRFLPFDEYVYVPQLGTCNGLLLCFAHMAPCPSLGDDEQLESHYVVCNPATERWVDLPPHPNVPLGSRMMVRLAFDPAASSNFHVFQFVKADEDDCVTGVDIYSSRAGIWIHRESPLVEKFSLYFGLAGVFFRGMLHMLGWLHPMNPNEDAVLVAVDVEGQVWKTIRVPSGGLSFGKIGLSQGCLHYATTPLAVVDRINNSNNKVKKKKKKQKEDTSLATKVVSVWYMKDYDSKEWVLKHTVSNHELRSVTTENYKVAAIHPDCDTIFLDSCRVDTLASFDMQRRKFFHILQLEKNRAWQFLPYVPLFSDSLAGSHGQ